MMMMKMKKWKKKKMIKTMSSNNFYFININKIKFVYNKFTNLFENMK